MSITQPVCVFVALGMQHAMRWRAILSSVARFSKKKIIEHKMCFLSFSTNLSVTFRSLSRNDREVIKNVCWSSCEIPSILVRF